jgi:hypothetical protein
MRATLMGLGFAGVLSFVCYQSTEAVPADGAAMKRGLQPPRRRCKRRNFTPARLGTASSSVTGNSLWGVRSAATFTAGGGRANLKGSA